MEVVITILESSLEFGVLEEIYNLLVYCVSFWVEVLKEDRSGQWFRGLVVFDGFKDGLKDI